MCEKFRRRDQPWLNSLRRTQLFVFSESDARTDAGDHSQEEFIIHEAV